MPLDGIPQIPDPPEVKNYVAAHCPSSIAVEIRARNCNRKYSSHRHALDALFRDKLRRKLFRRGIGGVQAVEPAGFLFTVNDEKVATEPVNRVP